ncbi:MAG TPA: (d)CMP kinase [Erysipelotrichaceae bacterium]|nr:(d)CMP kinase [Erysipelotrichaceae bacterium]HCY06650.1 (d)CMP kinase [Erysipelotrichaceae bacterium]
MKINIAIDGPSGAGKSSVSDLLAKKLGYVHLDTGAMYRAVAFKAINNNIALDDEEKLIEMLNKTSIVLNDNNDVFIDGKNVTELIRTNEMSMAASDVSKLSKIRKKLVEMQQEISKSKGYILDGRDIGTVVLKDAEVKIYLTASTEIRAQRRKLQNEKKGIFNDLDYLIKEIENRDYQDMNRKESPLKKADDAIEIDASYIDINQVVNKILDIVYNKLEVLRND